MVFVSFVLNINSDYDSVKKCLSSFCSQTFYDFEIICLNNSLNNKIYRLIESFENNLSIVFTDNPIQNINGDYVCFFNSNNYLCEENTLKKIISVIENYTFDMFSTNIIRDNANYNTFNVFYDFDVKFFNLKDCSINISEFNFSLSDKLFSKDFLINNDIKYDKNENLLSAKILSNVDSFLGIPIDFCVDSSNIPIKSADCINIFRTYCEMLAILSEKEHILNNISSNLLKNKFEIPSFSLEEYGKLEKKFNEIESSLKEAYFDLNHDILNYLRYIKEQVQLQVSSYDVSISIIIPTYNVERFIGDCLCSIINQSFNDIEVIVVDDCSTDSTVDIIQYYSNKDNRIKYFKNTRKGGSGGSRNFGLKQAKGKYVLFVDGDDWLDNHSLERLFDIAEEYKTQMVMFKVLNFEDSTTQFIRDDYLAIDCLNKFNNKIFNSNEIFDEMFKISVVPINKLYLRSFLLDINARFPEKYIHQDNPFFYQTFCECERVYLLDEFLYNRRLWKGSITHLRDDTELGTIEIVEEILKVFIRNSLYGKFRELLLNRLLFKLRNRYWLVGDSFREVYYHRAQAKLNKFMFDYGLYDDLMNCLWSENKRFFDSVVFTEDFDSFQKWK